MGLSFAAHANPQEFESQLIDLIYGTLVDQARWQEVVARISAVFPNGHGTLLFHHRKQKKGMFAVTSGFDQGWVENYQRTFSAVNPWMENIGKRPIGLGAPAELTVPRNELLKTDFYNDFLRPQQIVTGVGVTIFREGDRLLALSVLGADGDDAAVKQLAEMFTRIAWHIRRVINLHRNEGINPLAAVGPLIEGMDVGVVIVGRGQRVLRASKLATGLLGVERAAHLDAKHRLVIHSPQAMEFLEACLAESWQPPSASRTAAFYLKDRDGIPFRITVIGTHRDLFPTYLDGPVAYVVIEDLSLPLRVTETSLQALYGLSFSEANLLIALANGATLSQISAHRGRAIETVRSQLKSACSKLGVSRQADAVRLVCRVGYGAIAPTVFNAG